MLFYVPDSHPKWLYAKQYIYTAEPFANLQKVKSDRGHFLIFTAELKTKAPLSCGPTMYWKPALACPSAAGKSPSIIAQST